MILDDACVLIDNSSNAKTESKVFDFGATSWGGGIGNLDGDWEIVVSSRNETGPAPFASGDIISVLMGDDESTLSEVYTVNSSVLTGKSMVRIPSEVLRDQPHRFLKMDVTSANIITAAIVLESPRNTAGMT